MSKESSGLAEFEKMMPPAQIEAVLAHYAVPPVDQIEVGGGTASPKVVLTTREGRMLLKRRRQEFSLPEVVAYDHSVLRHLKAAGLPVACPLHTRDETTAVFHEQWAFELMPFIENVEPYRQGDPAQVRAAGRALAQFHNATAGWTPEGRKDWRREFHAGANAVTLRNTIAAWEASGVRGEALDTARRMLRLLDRTAECVADSRVAALPHTICHGDYTIANVFFSGSDVAAIFDFDWSLRQCRLDDLARGVITFASWRPKPIDGSSIWSLTQAWKTDMALSREFLTSYAQLTKYAAGERASLPWFVCEVALSMRVRAMRKVLDGQKLSILTIDMPPLLTWLEQGVQELAALGK